MLSYRLPERSNIFIANYNAAYFYIPKVASTSIKALCTELLELQVEKKFHSVDFPSMKRTELLNNSKVFKFAFVRNPFDRLASCYVSKVLNRRDFARQEKWGNISFDQFVQKVCVLTNEQMDVHFRPQHTFVSDEKGRLVVDFLGRLEKIDDDIETVFDRAGFPSSLKLKHRVRSDREHYRGYYSERSKKMVVERFQNDLQLFGYSF